MQDPSHATPLPGAASVRSQLAPGEDRLVQEADVVLVGLTEETLPALEATRPRFFLVLLRALAAWGT